MVISGKESAITISKRARELETSELKGPRKGNKSQYPTQVSAGRAPIESLWCADSDARCPGCSAVLRFTRWPAGVAPILLLIHWKEGETQAGDAEQAGRWELGLPSKFLLGIFQGKVRMRIHL